MILCASLVIQLMFPGVAAQDGWRVNYISKSVCALKGSAVIMECTYTYPSGHSVQRSFWMNKLVSGGEAPNLSDEPEYRGRVQYLGDKQHNCTVLLSNLTEKDQSKYYFRFITDQPGGSWQGAGGVDLSVTDLQVEVPERVIEGGDVTLTCKTTCSLPVRPTFTWYRNGRNLSSTTDQLRLQPVSGEDAGRYHCAVLGLSSPEVPLNVRSVADDKWAVNYISKSICALKGSAVTMSCTYTYPSGHSVQRAFWMKKLISGREAPDLLTDPEYRGRVQYLGDKQHNCSLSLSDVREKDQSKYYFRFITDQPGGSWQGEGGVDLSVTDLQVEVPERVIEGGDVTLTCKTTCSLTVRPTFTWYRNGRPLSSSTDQLHLQPVNSDNKDRYHCAVLGLTSPEVTLDVRYPPKNTSVSISPSGEIVEGSSVTLTCSSDANPPIESYTWFKDAGASTIGSGYSYSFTFDSKSSGLYYCLAQNEHGSQKSAAVPVNVKGDYIMILYVAFGLSLCAVATLLVVVCLMSRKKRKTRKADEHDYQNFDPNAKDDTYTALDRMSRSPDYDTLATARNQK
ncbi:hypothetical protein AOLI_G00235410 [Acnodon oligacanthus]